MELIADVVPVTDPSGVGLARRRAVAWAARQGFTAHDEGRVALITTEMATNLLDHGQGGQLIINPIADGLDLLALDRGPGMSNVARCLRDGYSSSGTAGAGLGAIRRQSTHFDVWSRPGQGAGVLARVVPGQDAIAAPPVGALRRCYPGQPVCGDAWAVTARGALLVDGLGHGPAAADAARAARAAFRGAGEASAEAAVAAVHAALQGTRGAAVAVAVWGSSGHLAFAGLGNISARLADGEHDVRLLSRNGTAGQGAPRLHVTEVDWPPDALLVLHSDGIRNRWSSADYPGLTQRSPPLVAGLIYRDHERERDDACVLVLRHPERKEA